MLEHQYSKAMHAECKEKKRNTHIYPGAKQEAEESPRPYPRHYPSILVYFINHPYAKVYRELGDTYGGANMPTQIKRRRSGPAWSGHLT